MKGFIGILILSAAILDGCGSGGSASTQGVCGGSSTCYLSSVAYGAGVFVVVGEQDSKPWIETSTDGINWKHEDIPYTGVQIYPNPVLHSIAYGKDGFVTTDGVHVLLSSNGLNWTIDSFESASNQISYVIYDGTRYILYSNTTGQFGDGESRFNNFPWKVSTDGVNWTDYGMITVTNGPAGEPVSIIHVAGMYEAAWQPAESVTGPTRYLTATSKDGLLWTLGTPVAVATPMGMPIMNCILYTGDQYLVFGDVDETSDSWGVALYGSSLSAMTVVGPLIADGGEFLTAGDPAAAQAYSASTELVSNGTVTVGLGQPGLFVTTDGITWKYESMDGVVPESQVCTEEHGESCTAFAAGAAAPGGPIVVLAGSSTDFFPGDVFGLETTDGIHWVKSNL